MVEPDRARSDEDRRAAACRPLFRINPWGLGRGPHQIEGVTQCLIQSKLKQLRAKIPPS